MEEKFSIKKLKEMIKEYLILQEDKTKLIIDGWKHEENKYEIQNVEERISRYEDELIYVERNNEILDKVEKKLRDLKKQVGKVSTTEYIEGFYPEAISDMVDEILTNELIEQDKSKFKIKEARVHTTTKEKLEETLEPECPVYNADMCYIGEPTDKVTVMEGIDNKGKRQVVYYYSYSNRNFDEIISQRRSYNEKQDIELVERSRLNDNGEYVYGDGESIIYQYDQKGRKKIALGDNDIVGAEYLEYDKEGGIKLKINKESICQYLTDGEKKHYIIDGYFEPTNNGYISLPNKSKYDIEKEEIQRIVGGELTQKEKERKVSELTPQRQEEVLKILRNMEPIFEYYEEFDSTNTEKREKIISWFKGFSKDLKIDGRTNGHTSQEIASGINVREGQIREVEEEIVQEAKKSKDKNAQILGE